MAQALLHPPYPVPSTRGISTARDPTRSPPITGSTRLGNGEWSKFPLIRYKPLA